MLKVTIQCWAIIGIIFISTIGYADGQNKTKSNFIGKLEKVYAKAGPFDAISRKDVRYRFFSPKAMKNRRPIIIWGNGLHTGKETYSPLLYHLASWGFVVMVPHSTLSGSGKEILEGLSYLKAQNSDPDSPFFKKLNLNKIGLSGHALGGSSAINAATDAQITCLAVIAPAPGKAAGVKDPMFLITGDRDTIFSPELVRLTAYSPSKVATIFGTISDTSHEDFVPNGGKARGYLTAWFMSILSKDEEAKQVFFDECEICRNDNWKVEMKPASP